MGNDRTIESDHVVAFAHHHAPPVILEVALQLDAERTVIPDAIEPAVDLAGLENEAAPFAQADDLLHPLWICLRLLLCAHRGNKWDSPLLLANDLRPRGWPI